MRQNESQTALEKAREEVGRTHQSLEGIGPANTNPEEARVNAEALFEEGAGPKAEATEEDETPE